MYALVSLWQLIQAHDDALLPQLEHPIGPLVRRSPGVVESYWTYEHANGKSVGFTLLDSAEHAHDLRNALESQMEAQDHLSIHLEMTRVQEVVAHVPAESVPAA